mgnify:CR=1 FL=1
MSEIEKEILENRAKELKQKKEFLSDYGDSFGVEYFILKFAEQLYAVKMIDVSEITEYVKSIPMPCTPDYLLGILNHRGEILPLINIYQFLGIHSELTKKEYKIAVVGNETSFTAVILDDVIEKFHQEERNHKKISVENSENSYIDGFMEWKKKTIPILDIKRLLIDHQFLEGSV